MARYAQHWLKREVVRLVWSGHRKIKVAARFGLRYYTVLDWCQEAERAREAILNKRKAGAERKVG